MKLIKYTHREASDNEMLSLLKKNENKISVISISNESVPTSVITECPMTMNTKWSLISS